MEHQHSLSRFGNDFTERVENALENLKKGRGVLVVDDESRENEGDLIFPAATMQVEDMALMIRRCSGIICLCLTTERADLLQLEPMVHVNTSKYHTPFTITIEAKEGVTTGVSAADRMHTIRVAVAANAKAEHLARPGHVFPLRANPEGVFGRRGHTEAGIDLMKLAGLPPEAVLCELTNDDGTMAKLAEICMFADEQRTTVVSVEDIFQYRMQLTLLSSVLP